MNVFFPLKFKKLSYSTRQHAFAKWVAWFCNVLPPEVIQIQNKKFKKDSETFIVTAL